MALPDIADYRISTGSKPTGLEEESEVVNARRRLSDVRGRTRSFSGNSLNLDHALLHSFAKFQNYAFPSYVFITVLGIAYAQFLQNSHILQFILYVWGILIACIAYYMKRLSEKFTSLEDSAEHAAKYYHKFVLSHYIIATVWLLCLLGTFMTQNTQDEYIYIALTTLFAATLFVSSSSLLNACRNSIVILIIGEMILMVFSKHLYQDLICIFNIFAQAIFVIMAKVMSEVHTMAVKSTAQKDSLITELQTEKSRAIQETKKAEEANASKGRFLATMSHELRTPLNAIIGFSEVMHNEVFGAHTVPQYKEYSKDIHDSGEHLLTLINELLDLSKIESGQYKLHEEVISLSDIASSCVRLVKMRAEEQGLKIIEKFEPRLPNIWADGKATRQILLNLLSNAIKFTPKEGYIIVSVGWTASGGQYFSVRDTGQGIAEDEIPTVLTSFGQGSQISNTNDTGTGLGLPICKSLVELHGGRFSIKSQLNIGTEVLAAFPQSRLIDPKEIKRANRLAG